MFQKNSWNVTPPSQCPNYLIFLWVRCQVQFLKFDFRLLVLFHFFSVQKKQSEWKANNKRLFVGLLHCIAASLIQFKYSMFVFLIVRETAEGGMLSPTYVYMPSVLPASGCPKPTWPFFNCGFRSRSAALFDLLFAIAFTAPSVILFWHHLLALWVFCTLSHKLFFTRVQKYVSLSLLRFVISGHC